MAQHNYLLQFCNLLDKGKNPVVKAQPNAAMTVYDNFKLAPQHQKSYTFLLFSGVIWEAFWNDQ